MYRIGINIYEKRILRQVGYLQEFLKTVSERKHLCCEYRGILVRTWAEGCIRLSHL